MTIENDFSQFLVTAKKETYASKGDAATLQPLLPDTKQLEYEQGDYTYRDIYTGLSYFVGQEIVYVRSQAVWSMAYSGGIMRSVTEENDIYNIYDFLRSCLRRVDETKPFRGPETFCQAEYSYKNNVTGNLDDFYGVEAIYKSEVLVYQLHYSGGSIM
ncbi:MULTISPECIES: DUF5680 domain-containing protein [Leuconostoc]|uniref:DUF5680 domain-containing protein n=2 Tax=Leuconostoc kimchii TaxID=136609 RepID=D5T097_LEUKI|nr:MULTISPECIES: DUF5680 domain-containing protein [Leuconostoc]ADG39696.1 hypothetical protein LKI_00765 [Leuconostoc kimchii IMSNU 11154]AEJ30443.1 hypothetical protein LGMK_01915 [Leuconostoc sp. C2]QBR47504.1 hypothetical protein EW139_04970 [Leuconostoc kimchii]